MTTTEKYQNLQNIKINFADPLSSWMRFSSLSKILTPYKRFRPKDRSGKVWLRNTLLPLLNYWILSQMNIKDHFTSLLNFKANIKTCVPGNWKIMQKMHSPYRFYLTSPLGNSNIIQIHAFFLSSFWLTLISFFCLKLCETYFLNKCRITIVIEILVNDKSFPERMFLGNFK